MWLQVISAAVVAARVGYAASVAAVLAAVAVLGAMPAQAASCLLAVSLGKAAGSALLSWQSRVPVVLAGVLLPFCMKGAGAAEALPGVVLPMLAVFLVVRLVNPTMACWQPLLRDSRWP